MIGVSQHAQLCGSLKRQSFLSVRIHYVTLMINSMAEMAKVYFLLTETYIQSEHIPVFSHSETDIRTQACIEHTLMTKLGHLKLPNCLYWGLSI